MTTTVVNIKHHEAYDVYGGRGPGGRLGNEFEIGKHGTRAEVIALKRESLKHDVALQRYVIEYCTDKRIGCFCHPEPCHCDIYAELCNTGVLY